MMYLSVQTCLQLIVLSLIPRPLFPADNKQYDYHWLIIRNQFFKAVNRNLTSSTSSLVNPSRCRT
eukprot:1066605-Amorphochlora_amoeboformis.AAC.1